MVGWHRSAVGPHRPIDARPTDGSSPGRRHRNGTPPLMIAPDRTPVPGRSPAPRRVTPDAPTQKLSPATAATAGTGATTRSAATTTAGGRDGGSRFGLSVVQIIASTAAA